MEGTNSPGGGVRGERGAPGPERAAAVKIVYDTSRRGGGQSPLGGTEEMSSHKGYGLALMVHILGGALSGASFTPIRLKTQKPGDPDRLGPLFLPLPPKAVPPPGAFRDDLDAGIGVVAG